MPRKKPRWRPNHSSSMASANRSRAARCGPSRHSWPPNGAIRARLPAHYFLAEHYFPGSRRRERSYGNRKPRQPFARRGRRLRTLSRRLCPGSRQLAADAGSVSGQSADRRCGIDRAFARRCECAGNPRTGLARSAQARQSVACRPCSTIWSGPEIMQKRGRFGLRCRELTDVRQRFCSIPTFPNRSRRRPFNWALTSSTVGLAERQPGGRLHVIFYGQEDGALARQLLVLPPGRYRLSMRLRGGSTQAKALNWNLIVSRRAGGSGQCSARSRGVARLDLRRPGQLPWPMARTVRSRSPICRKHPT